eukprot:gnl/TRDRNA2_/TRDRNA2_136078_c0_seq1.p3 gnl/TRDRNA2_/TRDRNA2_136078_c0~~gnl/TRDRNA2_/TRDRNA2_136078_c0_seq1.p3  ORF type:complete len:100 (+),score=18.82 gnl/TRDRNA2_/TRDRNA2_136078_c0_seq1:101-400(+)
MRQGFAAISVVLNGCHHHFSVSPHLRRGERKCSALLAHCSQHDLPIVLQRRRRMLQSTTLRSHRCEYDVSVTSKLLCCILKRTAAGGDSCEHNLSAGQL